MKLLYATSITLPSPLANRIQIINMAKAFRKALGDNFMLGLGSASSDSKLDTPFIATGVKVKSYVLAFKYLRYVKKNNFTHIFCREEKLLLMMLVINVFFRVKVKVCYEVHSLDHIKSFWYRFILNRSYKIISITNGMKVVLSEKYLGISDKILVAPDAVDLEKFKIELSRDEARAKVNLPLDKKVVMYTGSMFSWKGVETLYDSAKKFSDDYLFVAVGGRQTWVDEFKVDHPETINFKILGHKDHNLMPIYLRAADVLVLPNSDLEEVSRICTSPLKLFEYMASGRPIVASDLPSIREIVDEDSAVLVKPSRAEALAEGLRSVLNNPSRSEYISNNSLAKSVYYSWVSRADKIINFIQ